MNRKRAQCRDGNVTSMNENISVGKENYMEIDAETDEGRA